MTHAQRLDTLIHIGWTIEKIGGRHTICGEHCRWIHGQISGIEWSAWMSEVSGMVYFHTSPAIDLEFDAFVSIISNGWPVAKVAPKSRGFDFGEDD